MTNLQRTLSSLAVTVALLGASSAANLRAQSSCTSDLFVVSSSNTANIPAAGGTTVVSWHKNAGASTACASYASTTASWLSLQTTSSTSTTGSTSVTVAANPSSITRAGVITVQSSASDATAFSVIQAGSTLVVDVTRLNFTWAGGPLPAAQTINVSASGGAVAVTATVTSGANWLSVNPGAGYSPEALSVTVNPASLAAGVYQGSILLTGAGLQITIAVTLSVTSSPTSLTFVPASGSLSLGAGASAPGTVTANIKNAGNSDTISFLLSTDQPWLTASTIGASLGPGQSMPVTITASAAALSPGTYTGHVVAQGSGYSSTFTLNLTVTGTAIQVSGNPLGLTVSAGTKKTFQNAEQVTGGNTTVNIAVTSGSSFLSADPTTITPGSFSVTVDATRLNAGNYFGTLHLSCTTTPCSPVDVTVAVTVSPASGSLSFDGPGVSLNGASGAATPVIATSTLTNSGGVAATVAIVTDQPWLTATPGSANLTAGQGTPVKISANPATLKPGQYYGNVTAQAPGIAATYPVTFTVSGSSVSVTPNPATISIAAGTSRSFGGFFQTVGDSAGLTIGVTQGNSYLTADPLSQAPGAFSVVVDATKLAPGNYPAALTLHCSPSCIPVQVPITIAVTQSAGSLTFSTAAANLFGAAGAPAPQTASTTLQNTGTGPIAFNLVSDQNWLSVKPSSGTLALNQAISLAVTAATANLPPGTYNGHIMASGGDAPPVTFTVNLTVTGVGLYALPNPATFTVPTGASQTFNTIQVLGGSGPVSISVTSGSIWLSADNAVQAPGAFSITIDATYLKPGSYTGSLAFQCQQACVPFSLPINVTVTSNASLTFSPASINITSYQGRPTPAPQTLTVKSSDGSAIPFTITNPFPWLGISALSGTTPASLTLTPNLTGVTASTSGNLTFATSNTQSTVLVPVVLSIQQFSINATPTPLNISAVTGTKTQASLAITTADAASASIVPSSSTFWLAMPAAVTAPGPLTVKVDASLLGVGSYPGVINLACATANPCTALQIPVSLNVTLTAQLQADQQSIAFPLTSSGQTQTSQAIHLTSSDPATPITFNVDPKSVPSWLSITTTGMTTPVTMTFSVSNPPAKAADVFVNLTSNFGTLSLEITYTPPTGPAINSSGVVSGGALQTALRSGSWGTIYGINFTTSAGRDWNQGDLRGTNFPGSLDGVFVTMGGKPAPVRSISPTQINFQVPDGIGTGLVPVTVTNSLGTSTPVMATVQSYAPAFFGGVTANSKIYVAATETVDGGTVFIGPANTPGVRPAKAGENLTLWGTGFGPTTPNVPAGALFSGSAPLNDAVLILIDGTAVTPQWTGMSAAGLYQINIQAPNLSPGDHKISATIGGVTTPDGIWLATQ